jgi:phosphatidylinositol alpha-1,6-mannosyltransferase
VANSLTDIYEIVVVTSYPRELHDDGGLPYNVIRFPHPPRNEGQRLGDGLVPFRKWNTLLYRLGMAVSERMARAFCSNLEPDVIMLGCLSDWPISVSSKMIARGKPSCIIVHGMDMTLGWSISDRRRMQNLKTLHQVNHVLANSVYTANVAEKLGVTKDRISVIPLSVDLSYWQRLRASPSFLNRWSPRLRGKKVILSLGRLVERKGFDMVISAMPSILNRVPEALFVICGDGPDKGRLKGMVERKQLQQHVLFAGSVSDDDKKAFVDSCHVFTMPCRELSNGDFEGFGIVFLEAGICRKPVVAGNSGGVSDAVVHGKTGFLVDPTSTESIAEGLTRLLLDEELGRKMGENGRKRVEREFSLSVLVSRLSSILNELLNGRSAGASE